MVLRGSDRAPTGRRLLTGLIAFTVAAGATQLLTAGQTEWHTVDTPAGTGSEDGERPGKVLGELGVDGSMPTVELSGAERMRSVSEASAYAERVDVPDTRFGIPRTALAAYRKAAESLRGTDPGCHLGWPLLASIGRIESRHARDGMLDGSGDTLRPIIGPRLDGNGFAAIRDTDGGRLDGDGTWDRAVGPMQFIPGTWQRYARDGNGDGKPDPHNMYDSALAAGSYLCSGDADLADPDARSAAVFRYNPSQDYVRTVLTWRRAYASGVRPVQDNPVPAVGQHPARAASPHGQGGTGSGTSEPEPSKTPSPSGTSPVPDPTGSSSIPPSSAPSTSAPGTSSPPSTSAPSTSPSTPPPSSTAPPSSSSSSGPSPSSTASPSGGSSSNSPPETGSCGSATPTDPSAPSPSSQQPTCLYGLSLSTGR